MCDELDQPECVWKEVSLSLYGGLVLFYTKIGSTYLVYVLSALIIKIISISSL